MIQMKKWIVAVCVLMTARSYCQSLNDTSENNAWMKTYRGTATKVNDLVDTKLEVRFDYDKQWMYGKEQVTLHPHFYATDSLTLDAKSMAINKVALVKGGKQIPLSYTYDSSQLHIKLDKVYKRNESYTLYLDYVSRPNTIKAAGSAAITDNKGLYFINPKGEDKTKPIQIWTQGETESNSAWFPTIDKPDQKTTEQITMTVPAKYITLSNGLLISQKKNADGTRTDVWKMDLPHSPYLFFMGIGDYAVIKDKYKGKEVNYYVEKEYASVARKIFGYTPEMMAFYSRITGVEFPWSKYAQISGRDYVSGAMENTTATLHGSGVQQDARELKDGNEWENTIAHELFHQWFGDYVTAESWSNITVNESFADYSETLWNEYKHGKEEGDAKINADLRQYLTNPDAATKNLVRFYYADKEDVFDDVSYPKGGCILHMLRTYVGDSAFFKSLNLYLNTYKFGNAEAQQLRLAFEQVTGQDLNWFWNQWYYGSGHPKLNITHLYDEKNHTETVTVKQTQEGQIFTLPFAIDIYQNGNRKRYPVWIKDSVATYSFAVNNKPELVNADGEKALLCEKTEDKTFEEYAYQYNHAGLYRDRREALVWITKNVKDAKGTEFIKTALGDKQYRIRLLALNSLDVFKEDIAKSVEPVLLTLAKSDSSTLVKAKAIELLGSLKKEDYKTLFANAVSDSSYTVAGAALEALGKINDTLALEAAAKIENAPAKGALQNALIGYSSEEKFDAVSEQFNSLEFGIAKLQMVPSYAKFISHVKNEAHFEQGIDAIAGLVAQSPEQYRGFIAPSVSNALKNIEDKMKAAGDTNKADYVKEKLKTIQK